jgi:hypothetical protein
VTVHLEHSDRDRALSNRWPSEQRDSFTRPVEFQCGTADAFAA